MVRFSLIIPVYNVASYLRECLDSVLAQTYAVFEVICVDDGSTDGSGAILDAYAKRDLRIKVVHQQNAGVSAARNVAIEKAVGDYVWFVDGDDAIHPDALRWLDSVFRLHPEVDAYLFNTGNLNGTVLPAAWPDLDDVSNVEVLDLRCSKVMRGFRRGVWGAVLKRVSIPSGLKFNSCYSIGEDVLFQLACYWVTRLWAYLEEPLYFYRVREGSAINSRPTLKSVRDFLLTEIEMQRLLDENRDKWTLENNLSYFRWIRDFDWYTYKRMIFGLGLLDLRTCIPLWVRVQEWQHRTLPDSVWRMFVVKTLKFVRSPRLFTCFMKVEPKIASLKALLLSFRIVYKFNNFIKGMV